MISHQKKLIFIHIPKTGGKTFSKFLAPYCDEESLRLFSPQTQEGNLHAPWGEYVDYYGSAIADYEVVSIVRNPWDKALSLATHQAENYFEINNLIVPDDWKFVPRWDEYFSEILTQPYRYGFWPHSHFVFWTNHATYTANKERRQVDAGWPSQVTSVGWKKIMERVRYPNHIIRFEHYGPDVEAFLQHYDIKYDPAEVCRKTNTSKHGHYRDYYRPEHRAVIADAAGFDIQTFGYAF